MHRTLVLVVVLFAGCVPTSYAYTPASSRSFQKKADSCEFEVLTSEPTNAYEEVGELVHYNGDVAGNRDDLKKAIAKQVCGVGGDAVIAMSDGNGYNKARVIHYTQLPSPAAP
jgi:hypothetical protein